MKFGSTIECGRVVFYDATGTKIDYGPVRTPTPIRGPTVNYYRTPQERREFIETCKDCEKIVSPGRYEMISLIAGFAIGTAGALMARFGSGEPLKIAGTVLAITGLCLIILFVFIYVTRCCWNYYSICYPKGERKELLDASNRV